MIKNVRGDSRSNYTETATVDTLKEELAEKIKKLTNDECKRIICILRLERKDS